MKQSVYGLMMLVALSGVARAEFYAIATLTCDETKLLENTLLKFNQNAVDASVAADGRLVRRFSDGNRWTLISTSPNGTSCILAVGDGWETSPLVIEGKKT